MANFTDNLGRKWLVRITPAAMLRVEGFCGIKLSTCLQNDMAGLHDILGDHVKIVQVVWAIIEPDAERKNVTLQNFLENITGDSIADAMQALLEGLRDCFPTNEAKLIEMIIRLTKVKQAEDLRKLEKFLSASICSDSPSRWQRFCAWIRSNIRPMSWVACCCRIRWIGQKSTP